MNRLNIKSQLVYNHFIDDFNLVHHGVFLMSSKEGSVVIPTADDIAGAFMLFPKTTWTQVGGFWKGASSLIGSLQGPLKHRKMGIATDYTYSFV